MTIKLTPARVEKAALLLIIDGDDLYEWSSTHPPEHVAKVLEAIAESIRAEVVPEVDDALKTGRWVPKILSEQPEENP